jgi:predicted ATPase
MPHLLRLSLKRRPSADEQYPFSVTQIRLLPTIELDTPITFFVGENGSGKSTLLEGIAAAAELPAMGGSLELALDPTLVHARQLGGSLRLAWTRRSRRGFFLRAEDFFGRLKWLAREDARGLRERREVSTGMRANVAQAMAIDALHPDEHQGASFLHRYDNRSHGESFMELFAQRIRPGGLYLLDEPEAPLSPKRQIRFLDILRAASEAGAQFIVATHSPILLACPGASIYSFDQSPVVKVDYDALEHVRITRDFLSDPARYLTR